MTSEDSRYNTKHSHSQAQLKRDPHDAALTPQTLQIVKELGRKSRQLPQMPRSSLGVNSNAKIINAPIQEGR